MSGSSTQFDRACGALAGMAIGDALGMPTQTLARAEIVRRYGEITTFVTPFPDHPVSHGLRAGQVTDDTEQAFLLAQRLIDGGGVIDEALWARDLLNWEADIRARGLRDLLGPSSKAALDAVLAGASPAESGKGGTTNGAAMRIAPVGIAATTEPMEAFLDQIQRACRMTHNTGEAIGAAAAVAAAISCGTDGSGFEAAVDHALNAAREGQQRGHQTGQHNLARKIEFALKLAQSGVTPAEFADEVGTSVASHESVPAAFGVVWMAKGDPWQAALIAANIGDDTDTIGAIAGAMAGACCGLSAIDQDAVQYVRAENNLPIEAIASGLLKLRSGGVAEYKGMSGMAT